MARLLPQQRAWSVEAFRSRFCNAWARTDQIFDIVGSKQMLSTPIIWRHPFIFYVGHMPAFSWNQLCGGILNWPSHNSTFDDMFCRGIDPDVDTGECHWHPDVPEDWPTLSQTIGYRDLVRNSILDAAGGIRYSSSNDILARDGRVFQLILEHEYMHQETLLYMIQQMAPRDKQRPSPCPAYEFATAAPATVVRIKGGKARVGAKFSEASFGWDNEFEESMIDVEGFSMDSRPVTNLEFLEFVQSGAYDDRCFWRDEDWDWKQLESKRYPVCWLRSDGAWFYRAMFDVIPIDKVGGWPVYVSLAEARAYARWKGRRLPTEAEFHRAAYYGPDERESYFPWGEAPSSRRRGNFAFAAWSPVPAGSRVEGRSRWGVDDLVGNGWELTDTPFSPLPGFTPYMSTYPDYSRDFFDGKHFVVKGASWATDAELLRPSFRNWYQAHYPYVFAEFRCVHN